MKRHILLPTDFSEASNNAVNYAVNLYEDLECSFFLLNVFYITSSDFRTIINMEPGTALFESTKLQAEGKILQLKQNLEAKQNTKHTFTTLVTFNNPLEAINAIVEEKDIDLIVMGIKGKINSNLLNFGSLTMEVIERIRNCPTIVVPSTTKTHMPKDILFPTSYKTHFKKRELSYLLEIAKNCDASITIVHFSKDLALDERKLKGQELLTEYFKEHESSFQTKRSNNISSGIISFVENGKSDMIAIINKKHNFFSNLFRESVASVITPVSNVPILVMHDLRN